MKNPLIYLLNKLANYNNIYLDKEETTIQLLSHPYYPSINSITDLFNHFNIDNLAFKVEKSLEVFSQIPTTFLAQIMDGGSNQLVVVLKKETSIELIYDEHISKKISVPDFFELWTGILVVIEKPKTKTVSNTDKVTRLKKLIGFTALISIVFIFLFGKPPIFQIVHFALSFIGVYVSYLIVQHELGFHSKILDKFCSGQNKKTDCDAVLSSKGATIFGLFKLSDVGLIYFTSLTVAWLLIALNALQSTSAILLISTLAIPFTFFSIYYQWSVVKSWCPLCLTVVSLLWLQFGSLFLKNNFWNDLFIIDNSYVFSLVSVLVVSALWIVIQPLLKKEQKLEKLEIEYIKFKRNFKLFKAILNRETIINTKIPSANELVFGNKEGLIKLVIVTNPMCGYCKESHKIVEEILNKEISDIQIIIRFNVRPDDVESISTKISAKILELYHTTNKKNCLYALSDIYGKMDAETWLNKWGGAIHKDYVEILTKEKEWCTNNKINFTPAILVNGKQYPKEYDRMDLLYFIDDLVEEQEGLVNTQPQMVSS